MINKTLRRLAVGAAAITVAGVVVPLAAAPSATAATPTTLSVNPMTVNLASGGSVTFVVTPSPTNPTNGVSMDIYSGPDSTPGSPFAGTACTDNGGGASFNCVLTNGGSPGIDKIHFYVPDAVGAAYKTTDPSVDATATVAGAVNSVTISPVGGSEAQGVYQAYTVTATDAAGRPVPGAAVSLTISQSNATSGDLGIGFNTTGLRNTNFIGTNSPSPAGTNGSRTANTTTSAGGGAQAVGTTTFNAASTVTGTLNLQAYVTGNTAISSSTTLTIDPGTANDVTSVDLVPSTANAFTGKSVSEVVTLKNAQGDLVGGVTPVGAVTGVNTGAAVSNGGATDGTGTTTLSYTATNPGSDTLTGWVNQSNHAVNTGSLDPGEPSDTAAITVAAEPAGIHFTNGGTQNVPTTSTTTNVTFTLLDGSNNPLPGYTVNFTTSGASPQYSLGASSATTNAQGQVTAALINAAPANGNSATVTATLALDNTKTSTVTVNYVAPTATIAIIEPYAGIAPAGSASPSFTATTYDQFGKPVTSGLTYTWTVTGRNNSTNNLGYTGTGTTFSYTDAGPTSSGGFDTVAVNVTDSTGATVASDSVQQEFVLGTGKATQANLDVGTASGSYVANGPGGTAPFVPNGFTKATTAPVSKDYTPANVQLTQVNVALVDANGNPLEGKNVSFTSTGVGQIFTYDPLTGAYDIPAGNSATAIVDPCDGSQGDPCFAQDYATVQVASTATGTQTITATVDGVSDTATVTYAGGYVPVTPERFVDTRTGEGGVAGWNSGTATNGALSPNTLYFFDLTSTDVPLDADAYVFNVTAIGPTGAGNLRISPAVGCGGTPQVPTTSLINYQPGKDTANSVVLPNDISCYNNEFVLYSAGSPANVAIDLQGYYPANANKEFSASQPTRLVDTRTSGGSIAANTSRSFQVSGTPSVPVGARAVALNVTAIGPNGVGNLRVYPDGGAVPTTSNVNYIPGVDKAGFVVVQLPADGKIDVYSAGSPVNVAIDVFGYYPSTSTVVTQAPVRVFDSRNGVELKAGVPVDVPVTLPGATNGVPAGAQAVLVSLTAIHAADSTGVGNLRAYPTGQPTPTVSNVNYISNTTDVANFAIIPVGANGKITLYSAGSNINATVDILGYVPAGV